MIIWFFCFGIIAGYLSGFLGIGAGVVLMPIFILLGIPYKIAVEASLIAVFLSSLTGTIQYARTSHIDWTPCLVASVPGIIFAVLGNVYLIHLLPERVLQLIYTSIMFINIDLIRINASHKLQSVVITKKHHKQHFMQYILIGVSSGLMASLLGIGGGLLIVSFMAVWADFGIKQSVKTSAVIMTVTSLSTLIASSFNDPLPYQIGGPAAIGAILGGFLGCIALQYVKPRTITKSNYLISFLLGLTMLIELIIN